MTAEEKKDEGKDNFLERGVSEGRRSFGLIGDLGGEKRR